MKKNMPYVSCIVAAGGSGTRMGAGKNKLFLPLRGIPVIAHTLMALEKSDTISEIVLSAREEDIMGLKHIIDGVGIDKANAVVRGGVHRAASVKAALLCVSSQAELVAVHDGARPLIEETEIAAVVQKAKEVGAAAVGVRPKCTLKRADASGRITETVPRAEIYEMQTPQVFEKSLLKKAYDVEETVLAAATDDCSLVERLSASIYVTEGSYRNIKITTPEDISIAECLLEEMR